MFLQVNYLFAPLWYLNSLNFAPKNVCSSVGNDFAHLLLTDRLAIWSNITKNGMIWENIPELIYLGKYPKNGIICENIPKKGMIWEIICLESDPEWKWYTWIFIRLGNNHLGKNTVGKISYCLSVIDSFREEHHGLIYIVIMVAS